MADGNKDWVLDEDAATETSAESAAGTAPAETRHEDPTMPTLVLPKPVEAAKPAATPAAAPAPAPAAPEEPDNFPDNLKGCIDLLQMFQGSDRLGDRPTAAQVAKARKFARLKAHTAKLQNATPLVSTTSKTPGALVGIHTADDARLRQLVRTDPTARKIVAERDVLRKKVAELETALKDANAKHDLLAEAVATATDLAALKKQTVDQK